ncbi:unnamed protein product [Linum tenue]|uniref:Uncharacterized protein n=1 Tax=Linum tenue TaxID=586396 RepID=A0AAV0NCJ7_9ROSI|nr:unnamed protein product [Linum tenue]
MMQDLLASSPDTTSLSYWLNWRVLLCATWVLVPSVVAVYIIWKYEGLDHLGSCSREEKKLQQEKEKPTLSHSDAVWKPCLDQIHPIWLLLYRVVSFSVLLATMVVKLSSSGARMYFYYTQWTYNLVTVYFALGSLLSVYGCYRFHKLRVHYDRRDYEQGYIAPLLTEESTDVRELRKKANGGGEICIQEIPIVYYIFQTIYQICAGAVVYTDSIYWFIIFPFLNIADYTVNFVTIDMHTLNAVLLIGDMAMNSLPFHWFRIAYFILYTASFVLFQWAVHACTSIWWPYPFFDLASPYAPLWYLLMASLSVTCYGLYVLVFKIKHFLLSKCFPQSYHCLT